MHVCVYELACKADTFEGHRLNNKHLEEITEKKQMEEEIGDVSVL